MSYAFPAFSFYYAPPALPVEDAAARCPVAPGDGTGVGMKYRTGVKLRSTVHKVKLFNWGLAPFTTVEVPHPE